jgi:hypothetical protein
MRVHPVPQRTDIAGWVTPVVAPRAATTLRLTAAALFALVSVSAPTPTLAASVLSDGSVTPLSGTTATAFSFSVHYTSDGSPARPAQAVWAQVGGAIVTLSKVSGSSHDGIWQGTASLPAGTWQVTFHASTSGDPQPDPLSGPIVTVTQAPPPPPTPQPTAPPVPVPPVPPPSTTPEPTPPSTAQPIQADSSPTATPRDSASASGRPTPDPTATDTAATDDADPSPGARLASLLIVGGTMSLAGAAVLAHRWFVSRGTRRGSARP